MTPGRFSCRRSGSSAVRALAFGLATIVASWLAVVPASAEPTLCLREIARNDARYTRMRMKMIQRCEDNVLAGKQTGPCPDSKTSQKLLVHRAKLQNLIALRCGGIDQTCSVQSDNDPLPTIGWDIGSCPNFEHKNCTNVINHCAHISTCLLCINDVAVDQAVDLYYGALNPLANNTVRKCQRSIGREMARYYQAKAKALGKCWDLVQKGVSPGPCPDERTTLGIDKVLAKGVNKICSLCGGPDRLCGTADDMMLSDIGLPSDCPPVDPPGDAPSCGGPITTLQDAVTCMACLTDFKVDCVIDVGSPSSLPYPEECNVVLPTPTRTPTPILTATSTPSPTETATPTSTATPTVTTTPEETPTTTPDEPTPTATPVPTATATETPDATTTATETPDPTPTPTDEATPTDEPTP